MIIRRVNVYFEQKRSPFCIINYFQLIHDKSLLVLYFLSERYHSSCEMASYPLVVTFFFRKPDLNKACIIKHNFALNKRMGNKGRSKRKFLKCEMCTNLDCQFRRCSDSLFGSMFYETIPDISKIQMTETVRTVCIIIFNQKLRLRHISIN